MDHFHILDKYADSMANIDYSEISNRQFTLPTQIANISLYSQNLSST